MGNILRYGTCDTNDGIGWGNNLDNLTIIVPLKDRPEFTKRLLDYANGLKPPCKFILADGSNNSGFVLYSEPNIRHHYFGPDLTFGHYLRKCSLSMEMVDTPYVMFLDNDDFPGSEGIKWALDKLETDKSYACAAGQTVGFGIAGGNRCHGHLHRLYEYYGRVSAVEQDNPIDRIAKTTSNWIFYAVHRTEILKSICQADVDIDFSDMQLHEFFHCAKALSLGKAAYNRELVSSYRQYGTSSHDKSGDAWIRHLFNSTMIADAERLASNIALNTGKTVKEQDAIEDIIYSLLIKRYKLFLNATFGHPIKAHVKRHYSPLLEQLRHYRPWTMNGSLVPKDELDYLKRILKQEQQDTSTNVESERTATRQAFS